MQITTFGQTNSPVPNLLPPATTTPAPPSVPAPPVPPSSGGPPPVGGTGSSSTQTKLPSTMSGMPVLMDKLKPKAAQVFQSVSYNRTRLEYYVTQTMNGSNNSSEPYQSTLITRLDNDGNYIDEMKINDAGHGTGLVVENYGTKHTVYVWLPLNNQANKYFRFLYKSGTYSYSNLPSRSEIPRFATEYLTYHADWEADILLDRRNGANDASMTYYKRKISEVLKGIDKTYGKIVVPTPSDRQGYATINDVAYFLQGAANGEYLSPAQPTMLETYSWIDGSHLDSMNLQSLGQVGGDWKQNWHEPEGLAVYRDPTTKKASLIVGIITGVPKNHDWFIYRFSNIGDAP